MAGALEQRLHEVLDELATSASSSRVHLGRTTVVNARLPLPVRPAVLHGLMRPGRGDRTALRSPGRSRDQSERLSLTRRHTGD